MIAPSAGAHVRLMPPPPDWQAWLAARLGERPRRLGPWAELALYGALRCLDEAGLDHLPAGAHLRVASVLGPLAATRACLEQLRDGLPMPFSFLQSQPSQLLALLAGRLRWQGDGRIVTGRDVNALLRLAQLEAGAQGLLFGTVEDGESRATAWWWMPGAHPGSAL